VIFNEILVILFRKMRYTFHTFSVHMHIIYMYRVTPTYGPTYLEQIERIKLNRKVLYFAILAIEINEILMFKNSLICAFDLLLPKVWTIKCMVHGPRGWPSRRAACSSLETHPTSRAPSYQ